MDRVAADRDPCATTDRDARTIVAGDPIPRTFSRSANQRVNCGIDQNANTVGEECRFINIRADPVSLNHRVSNGNAAVKMQANRIVRDQVAGSRFRAAHDAERIIDESNSPVVPQSRHAIRGCADEVSLNQIAGRAFEQDSEPPVVGNHVSLFLGQAADSVIYDGLNADAVQRVAQLQCAGLVRADVIAGDHVSGRNVTGAGCGRDKDAAESVRGDNVAVNDVVDAARTFATDHLNRHAIQTITPRGRAIRPSYRCSCLGQRVLNRL